jgi:putative ABC transport system permease protein
MIRGILGTVKLAFLLAFKSIWRGNRWAVLLIICVMALSFAQLVLTPAILSGVTKALNSQQINTLYANVLIDPNTGDYLLARASEIQSTVDKQPGIVASAKHLNTGAHIEYDWKTPADPTKKDAGGDWRVIGIDPEKEAQVTTISEALISGTYLSKDDSNQILLGVEIAGGPEASSASFLNLGGVKVGEGVRLTYLDGTQRIYVVKGIFKARDGEADRQAFVSYNEMVSVLGTASSDSASQILIKTEPSAKEGAIVASLRALNTGGQVRTWQEYGGSVGGVVGSFTAIASLISVIGLVVAAIVMFIVIYINVINKKRQIGILRAIGVNRFAIYLSYLCQALFYAVIGIVMGGLLFGCVIEPYFAAHPLSLSIGLVSLAADAATIRNSVFGILLAAVFAGIIPVVNIMRHSIIRAIWGN